MKPKFLKSIIGLLASRDINKGTPVNEKYLLDFKNKINK